MKNYESEVSRLLLELERIIPNVPDNFGPIQAEQLISHLINLAISIIESANFNNAENGTGPQPNSPIDKLKYFHGILHDFFLLPHVYEPFENITIIQKQIVCKLLSELQVAANICEVTSHQLSASSEAVASTKYNLIKLDRNIREDYTLRINFE